MQWEYKHIRFDYVGRGITQEFNILDIDGERLKGWFSGKNNRKVTTLPELLTFFGEDGWDLVSHVVNQDGRSDAVTFHYMTFKRPKADDSSVPDSEKAQRYHEMAQSKAVSTKEKSDLGLMQGF